MHHSHRWNEAPARASGSARVLWGIAIGVLIVLGLLGLATTLLGVVATSALAADRGVGRRHAEPFHWAERMRPGEVLEIQGVNGHVEARPASGAEAVVDADRSGRRHDPSRVEIVVTRTAEGIKICALYPRPDGRMNEDCEDQKVRNNDVNVRFAVRVPAGVRLVARTVNGGIDVADLDSEVQANTVNGGIDIATSRLARAATVNGSIDARIGRSEWSDALEFETVNGAIEVTLPASLDCDFQASTVNGHIETDFPVSVRGRVSRNRLSGTIGEGGRDLHLSTVNGSIRLRSAAATRRR